MARKSSRRDTKRSSRPKASSKRPSPKRVAKRKAKAADKKAYNSSPAHHNLRHVKPSSRNSNSRKTTYREMKSGYKARTGRKYKLGKWRTS